MTINHYYNNKAGNTHKLSRNTNVLFLPLRGVINHRGCPRLTRSHFFKHPAVNPEETQLELQPEHRHQTLKSFCPLFLALPICITPDPKVTPKWSMS